MSAEQVHYFLQLILSTDNKQQRALIGPSLLKSQVNGLSEVIFNLLHIVTLTKEQITFLKRKLPALKPIGDIKKSVNYRKKLIIKQRKVLINTLNYFRDTLANIVSHKF